MMKIAKIAEFRSRFPIAVTGWLAVAGATAVLAADAAVEARNRLVAQVQRDGAGAAPVLIEGLNADNEEVRLTAARLLASLGVDNASAVAATLGHPDFRVRRIMITTLAEHDALDAYWTEILLDDHPVIKRHVLHDVLPRKPLPTGERLATIIDRMAREYAAATVEQRRQILDVWTTLSPLTDAAKRIVNQAAADEDATLRESALSALVAHADAAWAEVATLLKAALVDASPQVRAKGLQLQWKLLQVHAKRLPDTGWRFRTDPESRGRAAQWHGIDHDDGGWRADVPIESSWNDHLGDEPYYGTAWYRLRFELPDVEDWDRAVLDFSGVDEEGWIWVNGTFVGEHALGIEGWDVPFQLDVTDTIKPGAVNQVTVKVKATRGGAGIWRPVHLRLLDTRRLNLE